MVSTTPMRAPPTIVSGFASARSSSAMDYCAGHGQQLKALAREHDRPLVALEQDELELPPKRSMRAEIAGCVRLRRWATARKLLIVAGQTKVSRSVSRIRPVLVGRVPGAW